MENFTSFFVKFKSNFQVKRVVFVLNAAFAMAALDLISCVDLAYHATQMSEVLHSLVVFYLS